MLVLMLAMMLGVDGQIETDTFLSSVNARVNAYADALCEWVLRVGAKGKSWIHHGKCYLCICTFYFRVKSWIRKCIVTT